MIITIDGPAASGKSTTAKLVAKKMNFIHLDTGSMYRAITYFFLNNNIDISNNEIKNHLNDIKLEITGISYNQVILNNINITDKIRTTAIDNNVSKVSALIDVRNYLICFQRQICKNKNVVVEGRDIGTNVFPNAKYKFYITADVKIRAIRRFNEKKRKSINIDIIEQELKERDEYDKKRTYSPLKIPNNSIIIDTTNINLNDQVEKILNYIKGD